MGNYLDSLLGRVADPELASAIRGEVQRLRDRAQFGLVFEKHLPELVRLHSHPIRRGLKVQERGSSDGTTWTVAAVSSDRATLHRSLGDDMIEEQRPLADLVVVREFGDPIYPGLRSVRRIERGGEDRPFHTVVNAENYHAIETLLFSHEGRVDCMYLDPPYNTGARDWKYNNDYVDGNDAFRHSKWLSFMEKRLVLARRLLARDGVLIVTIDEKEVHNLGLLLAQVFPDAIRQMVTIVINPLGQARKQELARVEEFAFFVFLGDATPAPMLDDLLSERTETPRAQGVRWERLIRGGTRARRVDRPNLFFPVFVDPEGKRIAEVGDSLPLDASRESVDTPDGLVAVWPLTTGGEEGRWRCSPAYLRQLVSKGYAKVGAYDRRNHRYSLLYLGEAQQRRIDQGVLRVVERDANGVVVLEGEVADRRVVAKTVWNRLTHRAGENGTTLLKRFVPGTEFPFPKSLYAVEDALRVAVGNRPDAVVLDYFAGSGTTAHAVMRLNAEDGGQRRSIVVTNNEVSADEARDLVAAGLSPGTPEWEARGIFHSVTMPRLTAAVEGVTASGAPVSGTYPDGSDMSDGLHENVEFFDLSYLDRDSVSLGREFGEIAALLWIRAGAIGPRIDDVPRNEPWALPDGARYGVLFDVQAWRPFVDAVAARANVRHVFVLTSSTAVFQQVLAELPAGVEASMLYDDYLSTFEINTGADVGS